MTKQDNPQTVADLMGAVFVSDWGYEQTNIDFYVVTRVTPKTVTLTAIGATRDSDGYLYPDVTSPHGQPLRNHRPQFSRYGVWVKVNSWRGASLWDGTRQADTYTYGGYGH